MNNQTESNQKENQLNELQAEQASGSFANQNEATLSDEDDDPTPLNDLPVAQAKLDMVKGGAASPSPVLLVISDHQDFYYR